MKKELPDLTEFAVKDVSLLELAIRHQTDKQLCMDGADFLIEQDKKRHPTVCEEKIRSEIEKIINESFKEYIARWNHPNPRTPAQVVYLGRSTPPPQLQRHAPLHKLRTLFHRNIHEQANERTSIHEVGKS